MRGQLAPTLETHPDNMTSKHRRIHDLREAVYRTATIAVVARVVEVTRRVALRPCTLCAVFLPLGVTEVRDGAQFDDWLISNRFFGGIVRDWRAGEGFTLRAKTFAVMAIIASFGVTTYFVLTGTYVRIGMWVLAAVIAAYVLSRPTKRDALATQRVA